MEKAHTDFADSNGPLCGGLGAAAVALQRMAIASEFGGWFVEFGILAEERGQNNLTSGYPLSLVSLVR